MYINTDTSLRYPVDSLLYRFDARTKIIFLFSIFIVIFSIKTWVNIFIFSFFYFLVILLNKIPLEKLFINVKTWFSVIIFLCIFPLFAAKGRPFIHSGWINITYEGLGESGILFAKLFLTSLGARILTATTTIRQVISAFQCFSYPFKLFGFSTEEVGLIISIGAGFIKFFTKEARQIIQIGTLRGVEWRSWNIIRKPDKLLFLIQAIITRMYIIGFQIEESLRFYGYKQYGVKTSIYGLKWRTSDWIPVAFVFFLSAVVYYFN